MAILQPATKYSVRLRARQGTTLGPATLNVDLYSPSLGILASASVSNSQLTTAYQEFIVPFNAATPANDSGGRTCCASTRLFRICRPPANRCYVDCIEIFPTAQPVNLAQVRASFAEDPESYDAITGILSVAEENGQAVRAAFKLREQLYFVKEHSFYTTQDDGVNEPDKWTHQRNFKRCGHTFGKWRGYWRRLGRDRRARRALSLRRQRAGENLAGNSAHVGPNQLAVRPHALGARGLRATSAFSSAFRSVSAPRRRI